MRRPAEAMQRPCRGGAEAVRRRCGGCRGCGGVDLQLLLLHCGGERARVLEARGVHLPGCRGQSVGCKVQGARCTTRCAWCMVHGAWCMVQGAESPRPARRAAWRAPRPCACVGVGTGQHAASPKRGTSSLWRSTANARHDSIRPLMRLRSSLIACSSVERIESVCALCCERSATSSAS